MTASLVLLLALSPAAGTAQPAVESRLESRLKDIAIVEGVRDNPLVGYGMVIGLKGTGDKQQTLFTTQTLSSILQKMGIQVPGAALRANNVASVFVTATLPPFAHPGTRLDITVSSIGDAKSLEGGLLILTSLNGGDGQVYAVAQGPVTLGGYTAGGAATSVQVNHPTVGRVPSGGIVERESSVDLSHLQRLSLLLRDPDFSTARDIAAAINKSLGREAAHPIDSRQVEIEKPAAGESIPALLARIENITVAVQARAKVVINERTGTVVMGKDVKILGVSILHGGLSIEVSTTYETSQPAPFSQKGETVTTPQTTIAAKDAPAKHVGLHGGATVEELVMGLQRIGATARDIVAILQSIKAAGALQAELEVL